MVTPLPNFLILGAQKSGTTALYQYLKQHPDIFMPELKKEPNFLAFDGRSPEYFEPDGSPSPINWVAVTSLDEYVGLFDGWRGEKRVGEASTQYLYLAESVIGIQHRVPDAKLLAILRNPVDRAYSAFLHAVRDGREPELDFERALGLEADRIEQRCGFIFRYRDMGLYSQQLKRYFEAFERNRIRVLIYDDFARDPVATLREIFSFLEVDPDFTPNLRRRPNQSGVPRSRFLHSVVSAKGVLRWLWRGVPRSTKRFLPRAYFKRAVGDVLHRNLTKPSLTSEIRARLTEDFRPDVLALERLLERNLSMWLIDGG